MTTSPYSHRKLLEIMQSKAAIAWMSQLATPEFRPVFEGLECLFNNSYFIIFELEG